MSHGVFGHTLGLKQAQIQKIERLGRKKLPGDELASWDLVKQMASVSHEISRQIGILIDRKGNIQHVIVGEPKSLPLPKTLQVREGLTRLCGLRLIRTNLTHAGLTQHDLSDLQIRRLDLVATVDTDEMGFPGAVCVAHISPSSSEQLPIKQLPPTSYPELILPFQEFIRGLEEELRRNAGSGHEIRRDNRAILCALASPRNKKWEEDLLETKDLARTAGLDIVDVTVQHRDFPDAKYCLGKGKLEQVALRATQLSASVILFQENLSPNQSRHLFDYMGLKIIDRTQLILDIFAQRAKSRDGKLQVELAQLKYLFPRLREKEIQLSRLVGGIGGRGPGETKLEIHRRRARDRMTRLEKEIDQIATKRASKRALRSRRQMPIVSIVGYTNAGKSTLLNALTHSSALAEDKLFATLDPFSKRLRFPKDRAIIITDTVGFIRNLPPDLIKAFRATLEEIGQADLLVHVVDISSEDYEDRMNVVRRLLEELGFSHIPQVIALNKMDAVGSDFAERVAAQMGGVLISAMRKETCVPLLSRIESALWDQELRSVS